MRYLQKFSFIIILVIFSVITLQFHNYLENNKSMLCSELGYEESLNLHPRNFKKFDLILKIYEARKWKRIFLDEEINRKNLKETYFFNNKTWVSSAFEVRIKPNFSCSVLADIRIHGDMRDHTRGAGLPSLSVKLTNGHIFGVVDFILFRPITRNFDNEIFITTLLRELGLLAPRSYYVNVIHNSLGDKFIFQEKITKEFLENLSLREGAIYEGDERFLAYDPINTINLSRHRLVNHQWARREKSNQYISETALSILNEMNHYYRNEIKANPYQAVDYFTVGKKIGKEHYVDKIPLFDSIIYAIEAEHNLARDERRFYYDPTIRKFYPIYYDGMGKLLSKNNKILDLPFADKKDLTLRSNIRTGKILPSAVYGSEDAFKLLEKLDIKNLYYKLIKNGVNLEKQEVQRLINIIKNRLLKIKNFGEEKIFKLSLDTEVRAFMPESFASKNYLNRRLIFYADSFDDHLSCNIYGKDCKTINLDKNKKTKALAQELQDKEKNDLIFVGKKRNKNATDGWFSHYSLNKKFPENQIKKKKISKNVDIIFFGNVNFETDTVSKIITLSKNDSTGSILFLGGTLDNLKIVFKDKSNKSNRFNSSSDINGFTGCISFYDVKLKDISIESSDSRCEDAVNFVRSQGTIKKLLIKNSFFDSIDADFSSLKFDQIDISNSKNDCVDLSYGKYFLRDVKVEFCKDKGISIGEASEVEIENLFVSNSATGLAVKDFGVVNVKNAEIQLTKNCIEAYNKKQEFSGGFILSKKISCKDSEQDSWSDKKSLLKVNFF